jgi:hypothetical protein
MAPGSEHDIWVELVSRAAQLIVLAIAGGVVGAVIHDRDGAREDERRRVDFLLHFVGEVETAYGQVKTARRLVRTYGSDLTVVVVDADTQALASWARFRGLRRLRRGSRGGLP